MSNRIHDHKPLQGGCSIVGCAVAGVAALAMIATSTSAITVVEPGHALILHADSAAPLHPSQAMLGLNMGAGATGIESIAVDPQTGIIYVQVAMPIGGCPTPTTAIFAINPSAGGLTTLVNGATGFGICERGSDMHITSLIPGGPHLVVQNFNAGPGGEIATVQANTGTIGTWSIPGVFPPGGTFGMQFTPGIGPLAAGQVLHVTTPVPSLFASPFSVPPLPCGALPGPGDDLYIQPDGDIVFVGDAGVGFWVFPGGGPVGAPTVLPPIDFMFASAGLPYITGTRATVCQGTGEGFVSFSALMGGSGIFRINEPLTMYNLVLRMNPDEGIHDVFVGRASNLNSPQESLYFTVENLTTGAHQVWELTNICSLQRDKWLQRPHGMGVGFNVPSDLDWQKLLNAPFGSPGPGPNIDVADDFQSNGEVIEGIRWWGSYIDPAFEPEVPEEPECHALPDGSACAQIPCPTPGHQCLPRCITYDPATGQVWIDDCTCRDLFNDCQPFINGNTVDCFGLCPPGEICQSTVISNPNGTVSGCCECVQPAPRADEGGESVPPSLYGPGGMGPPRPDHDQRPTYNGEDVREGRPGGERATDDYQLDDGTREFRAGVGGGGDILWLNQFTVQSGLETIVGISVAFGNVPLGAPFSVILYSDPNNDGNPSDAIRLVTVVSAVAFPNSNILQKVNIPPTVVGAAGQSFFVAAYMSHGAGQTPAAEDTSSGSQLRSWVAGHGVQGALNLDNLPANPLPVALVDTVGGLQPGNWMLRANAAGSPVQTGACCLVNQQCIITNAATCNTIGGMYMGHGSICSPLLCVPTGACCDPNGQCTIQTQVNCQVLGGNYLGDNTVCLGDQNGNGIDDACEQCGHEIDGWLVSFHTDLPANQNPDGYSKPLALLGLYFCNREAVSELPTGIYGWDGHHVYEYFVNLHDCALLHSNNDPRPGANPPNPARIDGFYETRDFIYWLDIQAVVGQKYVLQPGCVNCDCDVNTDGLCNNLDAGIVASCQGAAPAGPCARADINCDGIIDPLDVIAWNCLFAGNPPAQCGCNLPLVWQGVDTNNCATNHFWGWHTSPDLWNDVSTQSPVVLGPPMQWLYPNWVMVDGAPHMIPQVNQAFQLMSPCPVHCPADCSPPWGDGVVTISDINFVISGLGSTNHPCDIMPQPCGDGIISIADITAVITQFGLVCP